MQQVKRSDALMLLLVERMNHLHSGPDASAKEREGFLQAVALLYDLRRRGIATWSVDPGLPVRCELTLSNYAREDAVKIENLLRLLGVSAGPRDGAPIRIPLKAGSAVGSPGDLVLEPRSIAGILRAVADLVEVPEKDVTAGVVTANESPFLASDPEISDSIE